MSRHKIRSSRKIENLLFLGNFVVASTLDIRARRKMKSLGYIIDIREGIEPPTPTRQELFSKLESAGYVGIVFTEPKRHSYSGRRLNPHQHVAVHYERLEGIQESRYNLATGS